MLRHHLLISLRNFRKYKTSFFINLAGLSTGMACAFLIYLWVNDEMSFDAFHEKKSQLLQVMEISRENGKPVVHDATQGPLADAMKSDLPEVESSVLVMNLPGENIFASLRVDEKVVRSSPIFAGKNFFGVFSFGLLQGDASKVLNDKNAVVISEDLAVSLFGNASGAVGKMVAWEITGFKKEGIVSGVFKRIPANSSLQFDMVLPEEMLIKELWTNGQHWWNEGVLTFLLVKQGTDLQVFNNKISGFIKKYYPGTIFTLFTRPYSSAYLYGKYENGIQSGGRIEYVRLFSLVAVFILVIACINFMNLSTARASRRLKEVGIKKTLGSTRGALISQFMSEAIIMSLLSLFVAAMITALLLPLFNAITGKELSVYLTLKLIALALGVSLVTGVLSGSYPAFYLSGFNPITVLKGKIKTSWSEILARKGLVIFQFTASLVLIIAVMVIYKQMNFIQSANPGYDKDNVIYFNKEGKVNQNSSAFLAELKKIPGVVNASLIQESVVYKGGGSSTYGISWPGKTDKDVIDFVVRTVDFGMIETLGMQVKEGRSFSEKFGGEDTKLLINETAARVMGLKNPVGQQIRLWNKDMTIAGVIGDFHISSFHDAIFPVIFRYDPAGTYLVMAKIRAGSERATLGKIASFYKEYNPGYLFDYKFLDNVYQAQYVSEQRVSVLSRYFAGLAILISCLGLFGLATFNAEIRMKEIGVRKVLGASVAHVVYILSRDFFKLVFIAAAIAFPLAWWAMNDWLDGFVYKIDIGVAVFVIALLAVVLLAILTVGFHALKAGIANPVKSLRTE